MEIIIKIPKEIYTGEQTAGILPIVVDAIGKGTPLPEYHGRLIECEPIYDELIRSYRADEKDYPERGKDYRVGLSNAIDLLIKAPTIIERSESECSSCNYN